MICQRCLARVARRNRTPTVRTLTSTPHHSAAVSAQTTTATEARPHDTPAALNTPGVAQPFSTPLVPRPGLKDVQAGTARAGKGEKKIAFPVSSVPAGTVLKGLNFIKGKPDPVALEDREYPDWLWGLLQTKGKGGAGAEGGVEGVDEGDLFAKSKKQRQRAAKALRKQELLHPEALIPKVPMYEQSVDLPAGDGSVRGAMQAGEAREELTRKMREKRRGSIKEDNFLKGMR
ncbi:hypothetical protein LTR08_001838 [Meristemomyces frigidus]|nr:hypothetical protein LTR08_001838 [Meristemomyces frigidus]